MYIYVQETSVKIGLNRLERKERVFHLDVALSVVSIHLYLFMVKYIQVHVTMFLLF